MTPVEANHELYVDQILVYGASARWAATVKEILGEIRSFDTFVSTLFALDLLSRPKLSYRVDKLMALRLVYNNWILSGLKWMKDPCMAENVLLQKWLMRNLSSIKYSDLV